jgi:hypothetical protein
MASRGLAVADPLKTETTAVRRTGAARAWLDEKIQRGRTKIYAERVTVTPEIARIALEHNTDNRKIRPSKLLQIKSDMNAGRFKGLNGETIIFAKTGELNDGQHRLQAVIETNKSQDMTLVFGVERESRLTVDTGAARSAGDHLALSGWPYASQIASVTRAVIAYERVDEKALGRPSDVSSSEVMTRGSSDKLLQECATYAAVNSAKFKHIAKSTIIGFAYYQFAKRKPDEAKTFFEKLRTGTNLEESSPIRLLREYLLSRPKLTTLFKVEVVVRAWNHWIADKKLAKLQVMGKIPPIEG